MSKLEDLYKRLFELEEEDKIEEVNEVKGEIRRILAGEEEKQEGITMRRIEESKYEFFHKMRKKSFHKNLREMLSECNSINNIDDIELALAMTSMLTHSLIEMKQEGEEYYHLLELRKLTEAVSDFLSGELSTEGVVEIMNDTYSEYIFSKIEE